MGFTGEPIPNLFRLAECMIKIEGVIRRKKINALQPVISLLDIEDDKKDKKDDEPSSDYLKYIEECKDWICQSLQKIPKISEITEENFEKVEPKIFEGQMTLTQTIVSTTLKLKIDISHAVTDEMFNEVIMPNIKQLYCEEDTVFKKCLEKGDSNLKTFFFELCVAFSRFSSQYGVDILKYLGSVYEESDFKHTDYQWVGIRKGEKEIGLRNLGCTCYINSLV